MDPLPKWIYDEWEENSNEFLDIEKLTGTLLKELAVKMAKGKSCGSDLVVAEMLANLDDDSYAALALLFKQRIMNSPQASKITYSMIMKLF